MNPIIEQTLKPFTPQNEERIKSLDVVTNMLANMPQNRRVLDARILLNELKIDELFGKQEESK